MMATTAATFTYEPTFQYGADTTPYRLLTSDGVSMVDAAGRTLLTLVIVVRRKPAKLFHLVRWDTASDALEHGSWFRGKLYPMRCDVSFDGRWMVYLAMGAGGQTWNGICRPPWLKTVAEGANEGTWFGGGYWKSVDRLVIDGWGTRAGGSLPFKVETLQSPVSGEDFGLLFPRMERDGWVRLGPSYGIEHRVEGASHYTVEQRGDDGWGNRPTKRHPLLRTRYIGYLTHGYTFAFDLEGRPGLLDGVDWAMWDSLGQLLFARDGTPCRYAVAELQNDAPTAVIDLEGLAPPPEPPVAE